MTIDPNIPSDIDDKWKEDGPAKGVRVRLPIAFAVIAVVALVGIWGGAQLKSNKASASTTNNAQSQNGGGRFRGYGGQFPGRGGAGGGGNATAGTVQSVNGNTVTLSERNGQTSTVTIDPNATISKSATGSMADITAGQTIVVRTVTNSNGTSTQDVIVGNAGFGGGAGGFFGGGGPPDSSSTGN
jgi:hypothetical protein